MPMVPAPLPEGLHGTTEPLFGRLPLDDPKPLARFRPEVGEAEKLKGAVLVVRLLHRGRLPEANQRRLLRVYGELKKTEPFWECRQHPPGIILPFAADEKIISKADQEASALQPWSDVPHVPPVEHVVEEDVTEHG